MQTIYLLKYNNYYDRLVKKETNLSAYLSQDSDYVSIENYDFVPGDGVSKNEIFDFDPSTGKNYVLVCNSNAIESRWFITEVVRTRDGRYLVSLLRDAIVDEYDNLIKSPVFIEKATVQETDPFIYNKESIETNQIKVNEYLIRDETRVPWLVAYISRKTAVTNKYKESVYENGQLVEEKTHAVYDSADPIEVTVPKLDNSNYDYTSTDYPFYPPYDPSNPDMKRFQGYSTDAACQYYGNNTYVIYSQKVTGSGTTTSITHFYFVLRFIDDYAYLDVYRGTVSSTGLSFSRIETKSKKISFDDEEQRVDFLYQFRTNSFPGAVQPIVDVGDSITRLYGISYDLHDLGLSDSLDGKICHDLISNENYYISTKTYSIRDSIFGNTSLSHSGITGNQATIFYGNYLERVIKQIDNNLSPYNNLVIYFYPGVPDCTNNDVSIRQRFNYIQFDHIGDQFGSILYIDANTLGTQLHHTHCSDACYDIVYIPYFDGKIELYDMSARVTKQFDMTKELGISIMQRIKTCCGENCTDIQIVPFCPDKPINKWLVTYSGSNNILRCNVDNKTETAIMYDDTDVTSFNGYISKFSESDPYSQATGIAFWSSACSNSRTITNFYNDIDNHYEDYSISVADAFDSGESKKLSNQCNIARLVSPNYNGQFEFAPAKIGTVAHFNIDFMYMPYTPYIHVAPNFQDYEGEMSLYGLHNLNGKADATGLVCNGSFSIPQYDDKWADYCIQNKNYQNIFDREIKNMEVNNALTNVSNVVNAVTGIAAGGIGGAIAGKNPAAIATGAMAGAIKGVTKIATGVMEQQEALDYKKDMYSMSLQNIKALPYSLSNVGVFNNNNKIFPFVELYTCTNEEKIAFENKLKYNGMTVGKIGRLSEYINVIPTYSYIEYDEYNYIKGKLIRLLDTNEDNHFINYLASEMDKGAFFRR